MSEMRADTVSSVKLERTEMPEHRCPSCGRRGLSGFYAIDNIPVHTCVLLPTAAEALAYPAGELRLGFCGGCGFICNTAFDPGRQEYAERYESTQGFSERFNTFLASLAERMVERYGLRRKTVLEIGCGEGEFLACLCQMGDNRGVGIDPAHAPRRSGHAAGSRVRIIRDFYSDRTTHLTADFICCRHTLEHIGPVGEFMRCVRRSAAGRAGAVVFFELPDVMRILREGAFWDVYYEHCSYFSAGSLARLFRGCGFEPLELYLDYGGQYIIITARPAEGGGGARLELEQDLDELHAAVAAFGNVVRERMETWRRRITELAAAGRKVALWGAGSKCVAFLKTLGLAGEIAGVVDISPYKQGTFIPGTGHEILAPQALARIRPDLVVAMNPIYCREIRHSLEELAVEADLLAV